MCVITKFTYYSIFFCASQKIKNYKFWLNNNVFRRPSTGTRQRGNSSLTRITERTALRMDFDTRQGRSSGALKNRFPAGVALMENRSTKEHELICPSDYVDNFLCLKKCMNSDIKWNVNSKFCLNFFHAVGPTNKQWYQVCSISDEISNMTRYSYSFSFENQIRI